MSHNVLKIQKPGMVNQVYEFHKPPTKQEVELKLKFELSQWEYQELITQSYLKIEVYTITLANVWS